MSLWTNSLKTNDDLAPLVLRLILGLVIFAHGAQKMLGWFGGHGFGGTIGFFTGTLHLPYIVALLVILIEFFGALMLIFGLAVRLAALMIFGLFVGIILTAHSGNGFFMNWGGNQAGEGYEYHLLVLGMCLALILTGAGRYSADRQLARGNTRR